MTPTEMLDRLAAVETEIATWTTDPREWGRDEVDDAVAVWDRIDALINQLTVLRRDHAVVLGRRLPDQFTAVTGHGGVTVHVVTEKTEAWDGHAVLGDLAEPVIDANGEKIDAIPVDVARAVIPACGPGATSSKWKLTALRQILPGVEQARRTVTYGDTLIARGPRYNARPPKPVLDDPKQVPATEPTE